MFKVKIVLIIILLIIILFMVYRQYEFNNSLHQKSFLKINDCLDDRMGALDEKLDTILSSFDEKMNYFVKNLNEVKSTQNKLNKITQMNNQSVIKKINQYEEEVDGDHMTDKFNVVFNSIESPKTSDKQVFNNMNSRCFVKPSNIFDNQDYYLSSPVESSSKNRETINSQNKNVKSTQSNLSEYINNNSEKIILQNSNSDLNNIKLFEI